MEVIRFLAAELSRAIDADGRSRTAGAAVARARTNVQKRVRTAIRAIGRHDPALAHGLEWTVKTGALCSYSPPRARRRPATSPLARSRGICLMMSTAAAWLDSLPAGRRDALAADLALALERDGLTVYKAAEGVFVPIPPVLSPEPMTRQGMAALSVDARRLLTATVKLAGWTLGDGAVWGQKLYATFTPLEQAALARGPARLAKVATARVDYFVAPDGQTRALELNATIPAMQGYSDLIAHGWVRAIARARGLDPARAEQLVAEIGSNTAELLASVLWHAREQGCKVDTPSIVIVCRRGDAQLAELLHYRHVWGAAGHRVEQVWVDEVGVDAAGRVTARGETYDLVYRHIFARLVDEDSVFGKLLVDTPPGVVIINPVVSPLEVKGLLALLHEALSDEARARALGLDDAERDAIARVVPWTRLLVPGPTTLADGTRVDDLPGWAAAHPERLVLKKSWDYGGKSVVLGLEADEPAVRARMRETLGDGAGDWNGFVAAAARQSDLFVLQELVPPTPRRHLLIERAPDGTIGSAWRDLFVDISAYCNTGEAPRPTGGACRASGSRIVNILGGGGLTPLVPAEVVARLMEGA
jgi:hypothetical protein